MVNGVSGGTHNSFKTPKLALAHWDKNCRTNHVEGHHPEDAFKASTLMNPDESTPADVATLPGYSSTSTPQTAIHSGSGTLSDLHRSQPQSSGKPDNGLPELTVTNDTAISHGSPKIAALSDARQSEPNPSQSGCTPSLPLPSSSAQSTSVSHTIYYGASGKTTCIYSQKYVPNNP